VGHGYTTRDGWFIDPQGRHTLLRGVNLSGSTKVPRSPDGATHLGVDFDNWRDVSFVGRPAPLEEIDGHLDRITGWGFNVLRLLVTWEAIEHRGPGEHDEEYLDYVAEVVRRAQQRDLLVFVDPHQDVWSRWTGGDGAPYWCLELAGLLPGSFVAADAVKLHDFDWPANYQRVPTATMWTLFFGGDVFCPELAGVQEELQVRYLDAMCAVAERVRDFDCVLGYDTLNEPHGGYIGRGSDLTAGRRMFDRGDGGRRPFSPLEHLAAGDGVTVRHEDGGVLNPDGVSIWRDGCPWRRLGVWDLDGDGVPVLPDPSDHFTRVDGRAIEVWADFMRPFVERFRDRLRGVHPGCMIFMEANPLEGALSWDDDGDPLLVNARHWYDIATLASRRFDPTAYEPYGGGVLHGVDAIASSFAEILSAMAHHSESRMARMPLLLGEFGIPFEMNGGEAFATGDYSKQEVALEANYRALDAAMVHGTLWNYTPDNDHRHGDQWNDEDLSIYSTDDGGGRGIRGFCRPHLLNGAGTPVEMWFDSGAGSFFLAVEVDPSIEAKTEVFVPRVHFEGGAACHVTAGRASVDLRAQRVSWDHRGSKGRQELRLEQP
jgi:Cellulase (glycosyl hydrolase family 5)/Glycoside hydrolase family 5 C-terminal domain